jgi:DNA-binding Lrp family transcriptional regulator
LSRDRDPFERTLDLLRRGLRAGDHGFGQPLHIQKLAGVLAVSATPVREALARLSGEGLIERARTGYLTRAYDAVSLRELYQLDLVYALATPAKGRAESGSMAAQLLGEAVDGDFVARTEALLRALSPWQGRTLAIARQRVWDRLAPFRAAEPLVLPDVEVELVALARAGAGQTGAPPSRLRAYYRARMKSADALLASSLRRKYHSNIP